MKKTFQWLLAATLALSLGTASAATIRIGWTDWDDAEFVTKLAQRLLEDRLDYSVKLVKDSVKFQYSALALGSIDLMLMSWQPDTHKNSLFKYGNKVEQLGTLYQGARLGWAVPDYVPESEVSSISDLRRPGIGQKLDNTITGIDAGAGITQLSKEAITKYNLDDRTTGASRITVRNAAIRDVDMDHSDEYELSITSTDDMTGDLADAVARKGWIVVTAWKPHWIFAAYDMRFLDDPKGVFGKDQRVVALARPKFTQDEPAAAALIGRMFIPMEELEAALLDAERTSEDQAVTNYIKAHPARVNYWVTGEL